MPDNSWITPYSFPLGTCLSDGPSQGMVYELSADLVIKMPYQYPATGASSAEAEDHLALSVQSLQLFDEENKVYDILHQRPHRNIARKLICDRKNAIILNRFHPLKSVRDNKDNSEQHSLWIYQLLAALAHLEELGYLHGDLKVNNIGVDSCGHLRLFDFGSATSKDTQGFERQREEDYFDLACCIHFIASGKDLMAEVASYGEAKQVRSKLQAGNGSVHPKAAKYNDIIQLGWRRSQQSKPTFSSLKEQFWEKYKPDDSACLSTEDVAYRPPGSLDELLVTNSEWMERDLFCAAWSAKGFDTSTA